MKSKISTLCGIFVMAFIFLTVIIGPAMGEEVLKSITLERMALILTDMGIKHENVTKQGQDPVLHIMLGGRLGFLDAYIFFSGKDEEGRYKFLRLGAGFLEPVKLEITNRWNSQMMFSKTYLSAEGKVRIGSELNLMGGVTVENIKENIKVFEFSIFSFILEVISSDSVKPKQKKPAGRQPRDNDGV